MKKGKEYELLIEKIYRDLQSDAIIKQDDFIHGHNSGTERQIDLSIRSTIAEADILIIVQAKDTKRPADIKVVEEFSGVVSDVKANKGILICAAGFTPNAHAYAQKLNIQLCSAHSAANKNWQTDIKIPAIKYEDVFDITADITLHTVRITGPFQLNLHKAMFKKGEKNLSLAEMFSAAIHGKNLDSSGTEVVMLLDTDGIYYKSEGNWIELRSLSFCYRYKRSQVSLGVFTPNEYRTLKDYSKDKITHTYLNLNELVPLMKNPAIWTTDKSKGRDFDFSLPHVHIKYNNLRVVYSFECKFNKGS